MIPGTNGIVEVAVQLLSTDPPRDYQTNTWHVNTTSTTVTTANWQALTDAFKAHYSASSGTRPLYYTNGIQVRGYDFADIKPRPEKAYSAYTPGTWMASVPMPRQVSLCLSYFAARNLKRQRGRVYLPTNGNWATSDIPSPTEMSYALNFGTQLATTLLGMTPSWSLGIYSHVNNDMTIIDHWWVNDVYDTQRRRARKETTRVHSP